MKVVLKMLAPAVALVLLGVAAQGQSPHVGYSFAIPQGIDPPVVIDLTSLNSIQNFTGADLVNDGVEFHGQIPGAGGGTYRDILQIQFSLYVGSSYSLQISASNGWQPWDISTSPGVTAGYKTMTLTASGPVGQPGGSAPINDHFPVGPGIDSSYLVVNATVTGDPAFVNTFLNTTYQVEATEQGNISRAAVPEPGMAGLAVGLFSVGGILLARRRRK